jgi:hypothetical protein
MGTTAADFRKWALALPEVIEGAHHGHADFRVGGKVFATLDAKEEGGMVKVPGELQARLVRTEPTVFRPSSGAWGRQGCTQVLLAAARRSDVSEALVEAWRKVAPARLVAEHDGTEA